MKRIIKLIIPSILIISCVNINRKKVELMYPVFDSDTALNVYFGQKVIDPYRDLENSEDSAVLIWYDKQRALSDSIMGNINNRDTILKEIINYAHSSNIRGALPRITGKRMFFIRKLITENIQMLYYSDDLGNTNIELFSTKELNEKSSEVYNIDYFEPSLDGKYLSFGISSGGDENTILHIIEVDTKTILPEKFERALTANPQWLKDSRGFFYRQLNDSALISNSKRLENAKILLHYLGDNPKNDREIFSKKVTKNLPIKKTDFPRIYIFPKSNLVLGTISSGTSSYSNIYYASISEVLESSPRTIKWKTLLSDSCKVSTFALLGDTLFYISYSKNPNGNLEMIRINSSTQPKILFGSKTKVIQDIMLSEEDIYLCVTDKSNDKIIKIDIKDFSSSKINLIYQGTINIRPYFGYFHNFIMSEDLLYGIESWNREWVACYYSREKDSSIVLNTKPISPYGNPENIIVEEIEVLSHDSLLIPLSIVYSKDISLNGNNPTALIAYGAYGISNKPYFDLARLSWLNHGGIFAIAHVRGGGEKGEDWYKGGFKETKPNSWKDFISCAEYLIKHKYTSSSKLAAYGGSAGGITIGRAITERPELFGAGVIIVGMTHTVRFENSINTVNITEIGTTKDSIEFQYLYNMDTYHHLKDGVNYPSMFFTAGLNDKRVEAWIPGKTVARMQTLSTQKNPILFRVKNEGHFSGTDYLEEKADIYTFLFWQLGHPDFYYKNY